MSNPRRHLVMPDMQVKPGVTTDHLEALGNYAADKRPDVIVCIGDFFDMPSLSSYDVGKASAEGRRYMADIEAGQNAMDRFMRPIKKVKGWSPRMVFLEGNHEHRISREAEENPRWKGLLSISSLGLSERGWEVHRFLKPVTIDRIAYAHYFVSGAMGRPVSSAAALLRRQQGSAVQGHVQFVDMAIHPVTQYIALFVGIGYEHDEEYLTPQGNNTKRGAWMLNEVRNGTFDPMMISNQFLLRKYL